MTNCSRQRFIDADNATLALFGQHRTGAVALTLVRRGTLSQCCSCSFRRGLEFGPEQLQKPVSSAVFVRPLNTYTRQRIRC